jgi:hypothetical protein
LAFSSSKSLSYQCESWLSVQHGFEEISAERLRLKGDNSGAQSKEGFRPVSQVCADVKNNIPFLDELRVKLDPALVFRVEFPVCRSLAARPQDLTYRSFSRT